MGLAPLLVDSGYKGRHLWSFFDPPVPAARLRVLGLAWARALAPADADLVIEVFPRQDHVPAKGLGNLIKLPLGIHLRTGRRCLLLDDDGRPIAQPWERLRRVRRLAVDDVRLPGPVLVTGGGSEPPGDAPQQEEHKEALPLVPGPGPEPFCEGDLEALPRIAAMLDGCALLRRVVDNALRDRRLDLDERIALEYSLGHLAEGVEAVNYLFRLADVPQEEWMGKPHSGSPISCRSLRRRLARLAAREACNCRFQQSDTYPNPLLYARDMDPGVRLESEGLRRDLDALVESLGRAEDRRARLDEEIAALRRELSERLRGLPGGRFRTEQGVWSLEDQEGIPAVVFQRVTG